MYQLGPAVIPEALIAAQTGAPMPARGPAGDLDAVASRLVCARDGWIAVAAQDQTRLTALQQLLGDENLEEWAAARDARDATAELQQGGIAAGPVLDAASLLQDPQLAQRGFFEQVAIDQLGDQRPLIGRPYTWTSNRTRVEIDGGAPSFGADNDYVLRELLGLDERRVRRLRADRIVVDRPLDPPRATPMRPQPQATMPPVGEPQPA